MNTYSRDETEIGAFGDLPSRFGADARTLDFLEGGAAPLTSSALAPALTPAQIASAAAGRTAFQANALRTAAAKTSAVNQPYTLVRAATDRESIASSNASASSPEMLKGTGAWNFKGQDLGLLPIAAKVVVPLVATAATGGIAAPSLTPALKSIGSAKATLSSGNIKASVSVVKQADALITKADQGLKDAKETIDNTVAAAKAGVPDAAKGLNVLAAVDAARVATGTPPGVPLPAAAVDRLAFGPAPLASIPRPAVVVRQPVSSALARGINPSAANLAALARYLVLDSGQVLADALASSPLPGWVVRGDGSVSRNG